MEEKQSLWMKLEKTVGLQKLIALIALVVIFAFFCHLQRIISFVWYGSQYLRCVILHWFPRHWGHICHLTGGIDLSIGTVMMCSAIIGGVLHTKMGWPLWLSLLAILVIGGLFGLLNGIMVAKFGLPPFYRDTGYDDDFPRFELYCLKCAKCDLPSSWNRWSWYKDLFRTQDNFPTGLIVLVLVAVLAAVVLNKTKIGRYIFAIGSNKEATRLSGVNVVKWEGMAYVIGGLSAGLAAVAYAATYSTILPGTGNGMELDAIAGVVVGGTSLAGGVGSVIGTIIGVFIMSVLKIGLPYIDLQPHYQLFITGFVVIVAVYFDIFIRKNKKK